MIVQAHTDQHKEDLINLTVEFHNRSDYSDREIDYDKLENLWNNDDILMLLSYRDGKPNGFLIGFVTPCLYTKHRIAGEQAWWAYEPRDCVNLFKAFEYWAEKIMDADVISVGVVNGESPEKFYKRHGYSLKLKTYEKELK